MTPAHWHLVLTHLPIVTIPLAACLLLAGILRKSDDLRKAALVTFLIAGILTFLAEQTGDGAEDQIQGVAGFAKSVVHQHEEMADKALLLTSLLAVVSCGTLATRSERNLSRASLPIFLLALATSAVLLYTGALGGKIRHTEIRNENLSASLHQGRS